MYTGDETSRQFAAGKKQRTDQRKGAKNSAKKQRRNEAAEVRHLMDLFEG
jgi:hypothetical protein